MSFQSKGTHDVGARIYSSIGVLEQCVFFFSPILQIPTACEHGFVNILMAVLFTSIVYFGQD